MENQIESIMTTVKLTEDEFKDINVFHYKNVLKGSKKHFLILIIILFMTCLPVVNTLLNQNIPASGTDSTTFNSTFIQDIISRSILPFIVLLVLLAIQFYAPHVIKKSAVKEFRNNRMAQKEIKYHFSAENIEIESDDFTLKLRYDDIHKVLNSKKYIILYESDKLIRVIPKNRFDTDDAVIAALQLLKINLPNDKYVTSHL